MFLMTVQNYDRYGKLEEEHDYFYATKRDMQEAYYLFQSNQLSNEHLGNEHLVFLMYKRIDGQWIEIKLA